MYDYKLTALMGNDSSLPDNHSLIASGNGPCMHIRTIVSLQPAVVSCATSLRPRHGCSVLVKEGKLTIQAPMGFYSS